MSDIPFGDLVKPQFRSWRAYQEFAHSVARERRYVWGSEVQNFLNAVRLTAENRVKTIPSQSYLYRARKGVEDVEDETAGYFVSGYSAHKMLPRRDRASDGRANPLGIPVLYAATQAITAISEVRPWIGAQVSLATLVVKKDLKAVDLSEGQAKNPVKLGYFFNEPSPAEATRVVWGHIDAAFSRPVSRDEPDFAAYAPTQILTEVFRDAGYDAVIYHSQFGDAGKNIAVFDIDNVEVQACAPFEVEAISIETRQIDNAWYRNQES